MAGCFSGPVYVYFFMLIPSGSIVYNHFLHPVPWAGHFLPWLSPGRGHCVVFLGKTLYSHGASLHPGV